MKRMLTASIGVIVSSLSFADAQTLIEAKDTADAVAIIEAAGPERIALIGDAVGLGVAEPVELVFALISPATPAREGEQIARAITLSAPRRADEVAASIAITAAIINDESRLVGLIQALLGALAAAPLTDEARKEEAREVLAALLSVADPDLRIALADAVAGGDGAALLAALGEGPETAAVNAPQRPFGDGPFGLTLTPGSAAQDAPSAN